jgi:hypothetical protein
LKLFGGHRFFEHETVFENASKNVTFFVNVPYISSEWYAKMEYCIKNPPDSFCVLSVGNEVGLRDINYSRTYLISHEKNRDLLEGLIQDYKDANK